MNMLALVASLVAGVAILLIFAYVLAQRGRTADAVVRRLSAYAGEATEAQPTVAPPVKTGNSLRDALTSVSAVLSPVLDRGTYSSRLSEELQRADLRMKPSEWVVAVLGAGALIGIVVCLRFASFIPLIPAFIVVWFLSGVLLRIRQARRKIGRASCRERV